MTSIELDLPQPQAYPWLWGLTLIAPAVVMAGVLAIAARDPNLPLPLITALTLAPLALIAALLHWTMRRQRAWVEDGTLHVISTFYHRRIPLRALDLGQARIVNLREQQQWRPWLRTNGFAVPGMTSGWYRLPQWRKAFAAYGNPERVLCVDAGDHVLLLGVEYPQSTLDKLRRAQESAP
jgi:hypothetical protein